MIDKKKIEEKAREHSVTAFMYEEEQAGAMEGFKAGVNWALQEFKKSLWHDVSEEPAVGKRIILEHTSDRYVNGYSSFIFNGKISWNRYVNNVLIYNVSRWLYVDDILPKEGGEE